MKIAVNDLSFRKGFPSKKAALEAMESFCFLLEFLRNEKISGVKVPADIINSPYIHLGMSMAADCKLMDILKELKKQNMERYMFLITILNQCGSTEKQDATEEQFYFMGMQSQHCARYRKDFLISLMSDVAFAQPFVQGTINGNETVSIRNLAEELHIYQYWEALGYREYERNIKHGNRVYARKTGMLVGQAPKTDEAGQKLLNLSISFKGKLYSLDIEDKEAIYEFPNTEKNIFHGFKREDLAPDIQSKIREIWEQKNYENSL